MVGQSLLCASVTSCLCSKSGHTVQIWGMSFLSQTSRLSLMYVDLSSKPVTGKERTMEICRKGSQKTSENSKNKSEREKKEPEKWFWRMYPSELRNSPKERHWEDQTDLQRVGVQTEREKREKKEEADRWERSMANKSSSNHDRNQMYTKDREREEER